MKKLAFKWLDAHDLSEDEILDFNYVYSLLANFEEEQDFEFEEEEIIDTVLDYQKRFVVEKLANQK